MEHSQVKTPSWLKSLFNNKGITDIFLNGSNKVYFDNGNGLSPYLLSTNEQEYWTELKLKSWVLNKISEAGKSWDAKYPFVDTTLNCGFRLHASIQCSINHKTFVSLRKIKFNENESSQEQKIFNQWKLSPFYSLLKKEIQNGSSMIISGATGSGKTTLANALLSEISPNERVIALEDTPELLPNHPHFLRLVTRPPNSDNFGEITLSHLLKQTLRMRPDRIILGECRGSEVLELLQMINTGHHGALLPFMRTHRETLCVALNSYAYLQKMVLFQAE